MNVRPEVIEVLRHWVRKAEHDLEAVRRIMAVDDGCPYDTACFHCQQAIEKYLKALLTFAGVPALRTHDLERLLAELPPDRKLSLPPHWSQLARTRSMCVMRMIRPTRVVAMLFGPSK